MSDELREQTNGLTKSPEGASGPFQVARCLHLAGATGQIRTAVYAGRPHVVLPVVALIGDSVIFPVNANTPEFVPLSELAVAPQGWNGRACVGNHPHDGRTQVSANSPAMLETAAFGTVFNARLVGKKLMMEAWLDPLRAAAVGPEALDVIERAQKGEPIEVSVGVFVVAEDVQGNHEGKPFNGRWTKLVPDHLALLPKGVRGACSNAAGCGVRAAAENTAVLHTLSNGEIVVEGAPVSTSLKERFLGLIQFKTAAGVTMDELRHELDEALRESVVGYIGIRDVFPMDQVVIYMVGDANSGYDMPKMTSSYDEPCLKRRSFKLGEEDDVILKNDEEEVEFEGEYKPVTGDLKDASKNVQEHSGGPDAPNASLTNASINEGEANMKTKCDRIAALIACKDNTFNESDRGWLGNVPEERLTALETATVATESVLAAAAESALKAAAAKPVTFDELLATAPADVQALIQNGLKTAAENKAALVATIKANSRNRYTDAQLDAKPVDELEILADLATDRDFSGAGVPRALSTKPVEPATIPDGYAAALAAKK